MTWENIISKRKDNLDYMVEEKLETLIEELGQTQEAKDEAIRISDKERLLAPEISVIDKLMKALKEIEANKFRNYETKDQPKSEEYR